MTSASTPTNAPDYTGWSVTELVSALAAVQVRRAENRAALDAARARLEEVSAAVGRCRESDAKMGTTITRIERAVLRSPAKSLPELIIKLTLLSPWVGEPGEGVKEIVAEAVRAVIEDATRRSGAPATIRERLDRMQEREAAVEAMPDAAYAVRTSGPVGRSGHDDPHGDRPPEGTGRRPMRDRDPNF